VLLSIANLTKSFFHRPVLNGISFSITAGEVVGLLGRNGAGKSTLLRIIAGLSSFDGGTVSINDQRVASTNYRARADFLYLGHAVGMYPVLSAVENLRYAAELYSVTPDAARIRSVLATVGLSRQQDEAIKVYSQGMLQRLKLALASLLPWPLLLFDEPFAGLDSQGRSFTDTVIQQWKRDGRTMLLVVHDLEWVLESCTRMLILDRGAIILDRTITPETLPHIRERYEAALR
jgi:ABC-2 type transport system ATP-binding protein